MIAVFQAWVTEVEPAMRDPGAPVAAGQTFSADQEVDGQAAAPFGGTRSSTQPASTTQ
jgi:hypothetical protein